jgi:hypothetical protein
MHVDAFGFRSENLPSNVRRTPPPQRRLSIKRKELMGRTLYGSFFCGEQRQTRRFLL